MNCILNTGTLLLRYSFISYVRNKGITGGNTMKAIVLENFGDTTNLKLKDVLAPVPKENEVRIQIKAVGFNPVDYKIRLGMYGGDLPQILGSDCSGIIDAVGSNAQDFKVGDEVYAMPFGRSSNGSYAEFLCLPDDMVCKKPKNITFEQASCVPLAAMTAYRAITAVSSIKKGDNVFIAGAAGGVGSFAVQLARLSGAEGIFTISGSEGSASFLQNDLGFKREQIALYPGKNIEELKSVLLALNHDRFFNTTLDFVGGDRKELCLLLTEYSGHFSTALPEKEEFSVPVWGGRKSLCFSRNLSLHFVFVGAEASGGSSQLKIYKKHLEEITMLIEKGKLIIPAIENIGSLSVETVTKAHELLEEGHVKGKLVMRVS